LSITIDNAIQYKLSEINKKRDWFKYNDEIFHYVQKKYKFSAVCAEKLELDNFPVDIQDLTITFKEETSKYEFLPEDRLNGANFGSINLKYWTAQEWDCFKSLCEFSLTKKEESKSNRQNSLFIIQMKVMRKWKSYHQLILPMSFISFLSLVAFSITDDNSGARVSYLITLLLTFVAFQTVVKSALPYIPIATLMDWYIYIVYGYIIFIIIVSVIIEFTSGDNYIDYIIGGVCILLWIVIHCLFSIVAYKQHQKEIHLKVNQVNHDTDRKYNGLYFSCDIKLHDPIVSDDQFNQSRQFINQNHDVEINTSQFASELTPRLSFIDDTNKLNQQVISNIINKTQDDETKESDEDTS